ncbi:MAG TPA: pentapeptide repeat-containing protein [Tepidisphaeraceae bacterium]|jgi:uncharacterized protein YjbI with pentapeptide repeats|nr:pentapeptide repeat-containing protein [Tepidisphaeraceae bacterium]
MLELPEPAPRPEPWKTFRTHAHRGWAKPFVYFDWVSAYIAWHLSRWSLLKVLAYAETFSVLIALIVWVAEAKERRQQKHYQAWQVINTAQGKGGSGGRVDALEQLNDDHVPLVGVDVAEAFLQDVHLEKARLRRSIFRAADMRNAHLGKAEAADAIFTSANLRGADLRNADLSGSTLVDSDLTDADMGAANVHGVNFDRADLRGADLSGINDWQAISSIHLANIAGVKNPPAGFVSWAVGHGAVQITGSDEWSALLAKDSAGK